LSPRSPRLGAGLLAALVVALTPALGLAQSPAASPGAPVTVVDADGTAVEIADSSRTVTLGGVITETAYALGAGDQIVAVDASSYYPPQALAEKTVLPYYRMLSAEPVLAADPTLVLGTAQVGPPEVVQQLRDAGVPILLLPVDTSVDGALATIASVGTALGRDAEAQALAESLQADLAAATELVAGATSSPKVLFLLLPPGAPMLVSGTGSEADTMIGLAGATNAVTSYPGYIPLTPEAAVAAAPDIILTTTSSLEAAGGIDGLLLVAGIAETPAGAARAIVAMEDLYLLGFGPRTGQAVAELATLLHPELAQ
jgi:iron complex transport system substrate-binding protein